MYLANGILCVYRKFTVVAVHTPILGLSACRQLLFFFASFTLSLCCGHPSESCRGDGDTSGKQYSFFVVCSIDSAARVDVPPSTPAPTIPRSSIPELTMAPAVTPFIGTSFCFSGETTVEVKGKGTLPMKELKVGDDVLAETGHYETVYSFGHRHETVEASFLQFLPSSIEISMDHMLKIDGRYIPASAVKVGDELETGTGELLTVDSIHTVVRKGVYAPFTTSGTIIVSNIKSSSYIAFQDSDCLVVGGWKTPLSFQWLAHGSQSPHRTWIQLFGVKDEAYSDMGMSSWIAGPHLLGDWYLEQSSAVMILLLVPALVCLLVFSTFEVVLSWVIYSKQK
jgi:hypothetical protein